MLIDRAIKKYRTEGFGGVLKAGAGRIFAAKYQEKLQPSFEERWQLVRSAMPDGCGSLLDIGSNLGAFTARAAVDGFVALGIEKDQALTRRAIAAHRNVEGCSFMTADLDPIMCSKLPAFDAILLLSVHHHWHHAFGPAAAAEMLRVIVSKANSVVIFEGPSRSSRYESNIPPFIDNAEPAVVAYYDDYLDRTVGRLASRICPLGKVACVGEREPYRWIYAIVR